MKLHLAIAACAAGFLGLAPLIVASPARAQAVTSNPVTQPLPPEEFQRLNRALLELAKRPRSLTALLDAGDAAIAVGDLDAAIGFFGRARELDPGNPNVSLGLASVYLRSGRPMTALPLFAEAREGGATPEEFLSDEALALDMVGDQAAAQAAYARVLATKPDDKEARRRLALSYAITGNATDFETTLRPLIDRRDFGAFRTRAFGLAIMGEQARAAAIVDAVMRRDLAGKITPYLEFMPRLTPAQQAAAANLGVFPRAADIGRDSPEIAAYRAGEIRTVPAQAASSAAQRVAGSRLEPTGEPLGEEPSVPAPVKAPVQIAKAAPERVAAVLPRPQPQPRPQVGPAPQPQSQPQPQPQSQPQSQPEPPARVADAFGDLLSDPAPAPDPEAAKAAGAVDIAAIKIPREQPEKAEPEPEKPVHPRRIWVQLATGRDLKALGFDWRRFARKAPDLLGDLEPYTVPWGQANRLLAGPIPSAKDARELVNALKQKGLDTFSYTSPEGTEIQRLGRK